MEGNELGYKEHLANLRNELKLLNKQIKLKCKNANHYFGIFSYDNKMNNLKKCLICGYVQRTKNPLKKYKYLNLRIGLIVLKILFYILISIFNLFYCFNNYLISLNFFITFIIIQTFSIYLIKISKIKFNLKKILISIIFSIITIFLIPNNLTCGYKNEQIMINNLNTNLSIYLDGEKQKIGEPNDELITDYKILNKKTNDYFIFSDYSFYTKRVKNIKLEFEKNDGTQFVNINGEEIEIPAKSEYEISLLTELNHFYYTHQISNLNNINLFLCIFSFIYLVIIYYLLLILKNIKCLLFLMSILCFEFSSVVSFNWLNKLVLAIFILITSLIIDKKKINFIKKDILIFIISLISTFCLSGNIILGQINMPVIFFEIILYLINIIILYYLFHKMDNISFIKDNVYLKRHKYILLALIFFILIIYKFIIGECFVHPDGYMQLQQIRGDSEFSNWHPFMHTLYIKYINQLFHGISGFVYFRIIISSLAITSILNYFYKKGLNVKIVYIIGILFALFPINILYLMTLTKDVDFAIALIYLTYLCSKFIFDKRLSILDYILFILCLIVCLYFRHNGIIVFAGMIILVFIHLIVKKKIIKAIVLMGLAIIIISANIVLLDVLKLKDKPLNMSLSSLAHGLDYLYVTDNLSTSDKEFLMTISDNNSWLGKYNKYNIDYLIHYGSNTFLYNEFNKSKFITIYLKNLIKHPVLLIKDRLYGTDIMWNVFGSDYIPTYRYHLIYDEYENNWVEDYNIKINKNYITKSLHNVLLFLGSNSICNFLIFRGGIYFLLINILLFYLLWIKKYYMLIIYIPCIFNNLSLFLAMHHQSYRYIIYIPFIFLICLLSTFVNKKTG